MAISISLLFQEVKSFLLIQGDDVERSNTRAWPKQPGVGDRGMPEDGVYTLWSFSV